MSQGLLRKLIGEGRVHVFRHGQCVLLSRTALERLVSSGEVRPRR